MEGEAGGPAIVSHYFSGKAKLIIDTVSMKSLNNTLLTPPAPLESRLFHKNYTGLQLQL